MSRALLFILIAACAAGEVRMPPILADGMVVQRGLPVHIWGAAAPAEKVTASFRGHRREATADELGRWEVSLPPGEAGGPFELTVNGITLRDVLVGDVWLASGQSNMEWPIDWAADPAKERAAANFQQIRLARTMHRVSEYPLEDWVGQTWKPCTPESVAHFSAVGYHFARNLQERLRVPIGVIQAAWGGTPAEAWTSMRGLSQDASLMPVFAEWAKMTAVHGTNLLRYPQQLAAWRNAAARAKAAGKREPDKPELRRGPGGPWAPAGLFNGMIAPLARYPIRGVIWYQGEANTASERGPYYERLFAALIRDWRHVWAQGDFPFLFVQLANYKADPESMWPLVREAQRQALGLANTAMVVSIDIGNPEDIHPGNKREVGRRLSLAARAVAYGEPIVHSGPLFRQATREGASLRVWFNHAGGLRAKSLRSFEVAGPDLRFVQASARIDGETVVVSSPKVSQPVQVRYAWADNPAAELFNSEGLPASPFRSNLR